MLGNGLRSVIITDSKQFPSTVFQLLFPERCATTCSCGSEHFRPVDVLYHSEKSRIKRSRLALRFLSTGCAARVADRRGAFSRSVNTASRTGTTSVTIVLRVAVLPSCCLHDPDRPDQRDRQKRAWNPVSSACRELYKPLCGYQQCQHAHLILY